MSSKNTGWIILGSVVLVLAVLIMVGPIMVKKYMRAKWQEAPHYQTKELLMNVSGTISISSDKQVYLKGDNGLFYVLEGVEQDVSDKVDTECSIIGAFRQAKDGDTVDGNPVRLFIKVQKLVFPNSSDSDIDSTVDSTAESSDVSSVDSVDTVKSVSDMVKISAEEKSLKKAKLRVEANIRLNKPILFDVIKGSVTAVDRKYRDGKEYSALILKDELGDNYMLYKKGKDLSKFAGKEVIVLGREILPPSNVFLVVDETTFEIYEVYDENYNKLM